jgi:hypothetical protein
MASRKPSITPENSRKTKKVTVKKVLFNEKGEKALLDFHSHVRNYWKERKQKVEYKGTAISELKKNGKAEVLDIIPFPKDAMRWTPDSMHLDKANEPFFFGHVERVKDALGVLRQNNPEKVFLALDIHTHPDYFPLRPSKQEEVGSVADEIRLRRDQPQLISHPHTEEVAAWKKGFLKNAAKVRIERPFKGKIKLSSLKPPKPKIIKPKPRIIED